MQLPTNEAGAATTMIVIPTRLKTISLDPSSGKLLWELPFGQRGPTVNAATPIRCKSDELFLTASYGIGNLTLRAKSSGVEVIHRGDQLNSQYATPLYLEGWLYGSDGREDMGGATYKCFDPATGNIAWEQSGMPICHTIAIQPGQLLLVGIDGQLWLLNATPKQFSVIWKSRLASGIYRALPALVDGHLLIRTNSGNDNWQAVDLRSADRP
jgi:outer membrane protein assembly factor BamB